VVLEATPPPGLVRRTRPASAGEAFPIGYLEEASGATEARWFCGPATACINHRAIAIGERRDSACNGLGSYTRREALELIRDPIRITTAVLAACFLMW